MKLLSNLYDISYRGNIRGKAKEGFTRPTTKQLLGLEIYESIEDNMNYVLDGYFVDGYVLTSEQ